MPKLPDSTDTLIRKLRLMADVGGMLTRDRIRVVSDAADRLEALDERIAIMSENLTCDQMERPKEHGGHEEGSQ